VSLDSSRFERCQAVFFRTIGQEVILAVPDESGFTHLSGTAFAVWHLLEVPRSLSELVGVLAESYGERRETVNADVRSLLDELVRRGLVEKVAQGDV
jgi:hypothetical protein